MPEHSFLEFCVTGFDRDFFRVVGNIYLCYRSVNRSHECPDGLSVKAGAFALINAGIFPFEKSEMSIIRLKMVCS